MKATCAEKIISNNQGVQLIISGLGLEQNPDTSLRIHAKDLMDMFDQTPIERALNQVKDEFNSGNAMITDYINIPKIEEFVMQNLIKTNRFQICIAYEFHLIGKDVVVNFYVNYMDEDYTETERTPAWISRTLSIPDLNYNPENLTIHSSEDNSIKVSYTTNPKAQQESRKLMDETSIFYLTRCYALVSMYLISDFLEKTELLAEMYDTEPDYLTHLDIQKHEYHREAHREARYANFSPSPIRPETTFETYFYETLEPHSEILSIISYRKPVSPQLFFLDYQPIPFSDEDISHTPFPLYHATPSNILTGWEFD